MLELQGDRNENIYFNCVKWITQRCNILSGCLGESGVAGMKKYEYKVTILCSTNLAGESIELNTYGQQGWRLVSQRYESFDGISTVVCTLIRDIENE